MLSHVPWMRAVGVLAVVGHCPAGRGVDWLYFEHCSRGKFEASLRQVDVNGEREVKYTAFAQLTT